MSHEQELEGETGSGGVWCDAVRTSTINNLTADQRWFSHGWDVCFCAVLCCPILSPHPANLNESLLEVVVSSACWRAVPVAGLYRLFRPGSRLRCGRCAVLPLGGIDCGVVWMAGQQAATLSREHKAGGERQGRELLQLSQAASLAGPKTANQPQASGSRAGPICHGATAFRGCKRRQASASTRPPSLCGAAVSSPWSILVTSSKLTQTQRAHIPLWAT